MYVRSILFAAMFVLYACDNGTSTGAPASSAPEPDVDDAFTATLTAKGPFKAAANGTLDAVVEAKPGFKVNDKYPFKFELDPAPANVTFTKPVVTDVTFEKTRATMPISFTASAPGTYELGGTYALSVCTDSQCVTDRVPLKVKVKVE